MGKHPYVLALFLPAVYARAAGRGGRGALRCPRVSVGLPHLLLALLACGLAPTEACFCALGSSEAAASALSRLGMLEAVLLALRVRSKSSFAAAIARD